MNQHDLDQLLHRALRHVDPADDFCDRVMTRITADPGLSTAVGERSGAATASSSSRMPRGPRERMRPQRLWLPAAVAAGLLATVGLAVWTLQPPQQQRQRGLLARTQLLQGLSLASGYLQSARAAVVHEEESDPLGAATR